MIPRDNLRAMVTMCDRTCRVAASKARCRVQLKHYLALAFSLALLALSLTARAEDITGEYLNIFNTMMRADSLHAAGRDPAALTKYREAKVSLQKFQRSYPAWNANVVTFRLSYLDEMIATLTPKPPLSPAPAVTNTPSRTQPRTRAATPSAVTPPAAVLETPSDSKDTDK
jgi:hypothetical protein